MRTEGLSVLVVGCGGIGGNVAARLVEHPAVGSLVALTTNAEVRASVMAQGFLLRGIDGAQTIRGGRCVGRLEPGDAFDFVFLATQPPQVEEAARSVVPHLASDGAVVVLQNGLCEERVGNIVGADRVLGAIVAWGASMSEPGVYERTSSGGFTIGCPDGRSDPRLAELELLLEVVGPVSTTAELQGARWSKLAINNAISTLGTIGGDRLGPLIRKRFVRRLALEIMSETVRVAKAEGIRLERVAGTIDLEWLALTPEEEMATGGSTSLALKHSMLLAVGARYRRMRSSMLAALERGRKPAIDFLNGEVVARAGKHGLAVPVNTLATELVHEMSRGERRPGLEALEHLFRATRRPGEAVQP